MELYDYHFFCWRSTRVINVSRSSKISALFQVIMEGTPEDIEELVPDYLSEVLTIAKTCSDKASKVEKQFERVMLLIGGLKEACTVAKGSCEGKVTQAQAEKEIKERRMKKEELNKEEVQEDYDQMKRNLKKADEVYTKAIESEESLGMTVGLQMIQGVINAVSAPLNMLNQQNIFNYIDLKHHLERELNGIYFWNGVLLEKARNAVDDEASSKTVQKELHSLKNLSASFRNFLSFNDYGHHAGRVKILKQRTKNEKTLNSLRKNWNVP